MRERPCRKVVFVLFLVGLQTSSSSCSPSLNAGDGDGKEDPRYFADPDSPPPMNRSENDAKPYGWLASAQAYCGGSLVAG